MAQQATIGRIVHYTFSEEDIERLHGSKHAIGEVRPAMIVRWWPNEYGTEPGYNLQVFTDGTNDGMPNVVWLVSRELVDTPAPGKCHWPPRA